MLKKFGMIMLAVLLVFGLVMLGCDNGSTKPPPNPPVEVLDEFLHILSPITLTLANNFQYDESYQGVGSWAKLFDGQQVKTGDEYQLLIEFTVDRDLEHKLSVGLVDTVQRGVWPDATYWHPLSFISSADGGEDMFELVEADGDEVLKTGKTYQFTVDFTALASAINNAPLSNALVFATKGTRAPGTTPEQNTGSLHPPVLTFTKFYFAKGMEIDESQINIDPIEPTAEMFNISGEHLQYLSDGAVVGFTVTPKFEKCDGAITIYYTGTDPVVAASTTVPQTAGVYSVTFNVAESSDGSFLAGTGLAAGTLDVRTEKPANNTLGSFLTLVGSGFDIDLSVELVHNVNLPR